ncbi:PREDICTED: uncharacterized protein LOC104586321 [Nelumbo nucifera]|uniref:acylphosphatase n=2 Tax=Nelumbo nucifera TaxID=4432 RepID=A0A822Y3Q2_NELNU|nr:PREDICTED: uncharacterized protein LOC104586321 [Nelumbo nucifera]DAD28554.1 TPA_asm: hypothetical protein HUJ06_030022 [Nelumbo nucifera]DAD28557.1 TPA_asm: hypothetical protein HUJ06_030025 [Nelumbo nucifera]
MATAVAPLSDSIRVFTAIVRNHRQVLRVSLASRLALVRRPIHHRSPSVPAIFSPIPSLLRRYSVVSHAMNGNTTTSNGEGSPLGNTAAPGAGTNPPPSNTVRAVIKGRVQGVFYRNWTIENAQQLGLKGWVRNRKDGSVEALFSGDPDSVHEMEKRCRRGPPDAMVTSLQVFPSNDDPGPGFERRPTV